MSNDKTSHSLKLFHFLKGKKIQRLGMYGLVNLKNTKNDGWNEFSKEITLKKH